MRLAHFSHDGRSRLGVVVDDQVNDLAASAPDLPTDPIAFLTAGQPALDAARVATDASPAWLPLADVRLLAPVPRPGKFVAMALNYRDHLEETGQPAPAFPTFFTKQSTCVVGPGDDIEVPRVSDLVDYEGELAVVIGTRCRHVAAADALSVVAGYTIVNDVTVRDWQMKAPTMMIGKSFDTHGPMGPWIVTTDELPDPQTLGLRTTVNGEVLQDGNTKHMLFDIATQIETLSTAMTLEPGDVISTGTPAGVGIVRQPMVLLKPGDVVRIEIEGIGALENPVVAEPGPMSLHRLTTISIAVPDVDACAAFYRDFGLTEVAPGRFATSDGGEQLHLTHGERRMLAELGLGVDDGDDLDRLESSVQASGFATERAGDGFVVEDEPTGVRVQVDIAPRLPASTNGAPGPRSNERAPAVDREHQVRPRKLGHVVLGSPDAATTRQLFLDGLGFKVSDEITGLAAFMRCSTDHHNVLVQDSPVPMLHHTSWMVDDADEVGRGGNAMVATDPERHLWGLGRHYIGSNWFWYLRDPAGSYAEYYADLDVITDDAAWRSMAVADKRALFAWAPPVPDDFIAPPDIVAALG